MSLFLKKWQFLIAAVITGCAAWWLTTSPSPESLPGNMAVFHWDQDCRNSYDFNLKTNTTFGSQDKESYRLAVSGTLNMRVFEVNDEIKLAFHFFPVSVSANDQQDELLEELYSTPFSVSLKPTGEFISFDFPKQLPLQDSDMIKQLLSGLETILPLNVDSLYTAKQQDQSGTYLTKYKRGPDHGIMQKLNYVNKPNDSSRVMSAQIRIKSSQFEFSPDRKGCWLDSLSGQEHLQISIGEGDNSFLTDALTHIFLKKQTGLAADKVLWQSENLATLLELQGSEKKRQSIRLTRKERALDKSLQRLAQTSDGILASLLKVDDKSLKLLKRYLETHPEKISQIPDLLLSKEKSDKAVAEIILLLGKIGSVEAQGALLEIWRNSSFSEDDHLQAILSFTGLDKPPTNEAFSMLTSQINRIQSGQPNPHLVSTPVLVSGIVIKNIRESHPDIASQLNQELVDLLQITSDTAQAKILLLALGNSRIEENADIIGSYISDSNPILRETAVRMAARYSGEQCAHALMENLSNESVPEIQVGMLKSLQEQPLTIDDLDGIQSTLLTSPDATVRAAAISALGSHKELNPEDVIAKLKSAYQQETSRENIKRIIKVLHQQ